MHMQRFGQDLEGWGKNNVHEKHNIGLVTLYQYHDSIDSTHETRAFQREFMPKLYHRNKNENRKTFKNMNLGRLKANESRYPSNKQSFHQGINQQMADKCVTQEKLQSIIFRTNHYGRQETRKNSINAFLMLKKRRQTQGDLSIKKSLGKSINSINYVDTIQEKATLIKDKQRNASLRQNNYINRLIVSEKQKNRKIERPFINYKNYRCISQLNKTRSNERRSINRQDSIVRDNKATMKQKVTRNNEGLSEAQNVLMMNSCLLSLKSSGNRDIKCFLEQFCLQRNSKKRSKTQSEVQ